MDIGPLNLTSYTHKRLGNWEPDLAYLSASSKRAKIQQVLRFLCGNFWNKNTMYYIPNDLCIIVDPLPRIFEKQ